MKPITPKARLILWRAGILAALAGIIGLLSAFLPTVALVVAVSVLAFLTFGAYVALAPWWTTRAGRASFVLFASLVILCLHFIIETTVEQSPTFVENVVVCLVGTALAFNLLTIVYKQIHFRGQERP